MPAVPHVPAARDLGTEGSWPLSASPGWRQGKKIVVKMGGGLPLLERPAGLWSADAWNPALRGPRRSEHVFKHTQEFSPGDLVALGTGLAAQSPRQRYRLRSCIEPLGPESGTRPVVKDFSSEVRKLCDRYGALLTFDEVVTGFRVGLSGAQGYFGVEPDLTVFGKVLGQEAIPSRRRFFHCWNEGFPPTDVDGLRYSA